MTILGGVDDAGRGPVLGPMVLAGVVIDEKNIPKLKELGVKDSKLLTPTQRENLFEKIKKTVIAYKIVIVQPNEIDHAVFSENTNLNHLEAEKFAEITNALQPDEMIVDCPSTNINAYTATLQQLLTVTTKLRCEHKADFKFPVVGAASVLAKVTRDREIEKLQKRFKDNLGSGYPSDVRTQAFLKKNWNKYPELFRKSWATYKAYSEGKKQKSISDFP